MLLHTYPYIEGELLTANGKEMQMGKKVEGAEELGELVNLIKEKLMSDERELPETSLENIKEEPTFGSDAEDLALLNSIGEIETDKSFITNEHSISSTAVVKSEKCVNGIQAALEPDLFENMEEFLPISPKKIKKEKLDNCSDAEGILTPWKFKEEQDLRIKTETIRIAKQFFIYDGYNEITQSLLQYEVDLIVVYVKQISDSALTVAFPHFSSNNIAFIDNADNNEPQAVFLTDKKSDEQLENEKYALRLVSHSNAKLCNCREAFNIIVNVKSSRPWYSNSHLRIGSGISIAVSGIQWNGIIIAKNESTIKLRMIWNDTDEELRIIWPC
uniref:Uncharacterized protein n=1 Tax=Glossina morsitans morsitans TaxID=37546 RepID=A0A1B0F990_GLOMM